MKEQILELPAHLIGICFICFKIVFRIFSSYGVMLHGTGTVINAELRHTLLYLSIE